MASAIKYVFQFGPLIFAFGFLTPLFAELIRLGGWSLPLGLTPLGAAFVLAGLLGTVAQIRGSWV